MGGNLKCGWCTLLRSYSRIASFSTHWWDPVVFGVPKISPSGTIVSTAKSFRKSVQNDEISHFETDFLRSTKGVHEKHKIPSIPSLCERKPGIPRVACAEMQYSHTTPHPVFLEEYRVRRPFFFQSIRPRKATLFVVASRVVQPY